MNSEKLMGEQDGGNASQWESVMRDVKFGGGETESRDEQLRLKNRMYEAAAQKSGYLSGLRREMEEPFKNDNIRGLREVADGIGVVLRSREDYDMQFNQALIEYVDTRFGEDAKQDMARERFNNTISGELERSSRLFNGVADALLEADSLDGRSKELNEYLADMADRSRSDAVSADQDIARLYADYIDSPTKSKRLELERKVGNESSCVAGGLDSAVQALGEQRGGAIEDFADRVNNLRIGVRDGEPNDLHYHGAAMDYVKFMMQNAGVTEVDDTNKPNSVIGLFD